MPSYKLHYFNAKGRAEPCRLLFAAAGQHYEDVRWAGEEWQKFKPKTPLGQMPVLEVDGKMLAQSNTMARYLAREFDMLGENAFQAAQADQIVDTISDILPKLMQARFEKDEKEKEKKMKEFKEKTLPNGLEGLEKMASVEPGQFFIGDKMLWCDIVFFHVSSWFSNFLEDFSKYPKLSEIIKNVESNPKIKKWLDSRPQTEN